MKRLLIAFFLFILLKPSKASSDSQNLEFRFTRPLYNVTIPENSIGKQYALSQIGEERIGIPISDASQLGELRFKIVSGDRDKFFKAEEKIVGDFCFLFIRTRTGNTAVLNRERRDRYLLEVRATATRRDDKRKYVLEADTVIDVQVLDTNDLNPLFYPTEYETTIPEDFPVHKSILKVIAEDADLGRNGEIYYSFLEPTDQFAIHSITGVISLTRPLKFADAPYYELIVLGQDRGLNLRSGTVQSSRAKVSIRIKQVNLYAPEIKVRRLPHIVENSNADIYAIVNVLDKDKGIHGEIALLEITDGDPDGHFRIRPGKQKGEFNIEVLKLLDRETTPQGYQLKLRAMDAGIPPRESYKSVPVHLTDLNDNPPVFSKGIYDVKVSENVPINTPLIRLKVTDKDEGRNALVFLEIVGGNDGKEFRIDPESGVLYTAAKLDYEQKSLYSLTVSAIDQGNTGTRKQSSAKVKINVLDENDNDPTFEKNEMTLWINENEPSGTSVAKVVARDRDSGENAYISYSIVNLKPVPFEVDPFTGIIRTTQVIDYESMKRKYVLRVRASDWGLPYRRQTEMQLTIQIKDINDNRPQFEKIDCTGHLPRYIKIGTEIITLSAIDFDANNEISYRIVTGNEDSCFHLDQVSGTLSVTCDLADIRVNQRVVNITATDGTHFADTMSVKIELRNAKRNSGTSGKYINDEFGAFECKDTGVTRRYSEVMAAAERNKQESYNSEDYLMMPTRYGLNIHSPEFIDFPNEIKVNESDPIGTVLTKIKARDRDLGYNGKLIYGITSGDDNSVFRINLETGSLEIAGNLDREKQDEYVLNITVFDLGKPQKSASKVLPIMILDTNDNAPKFEKNLASFRVTENALNGTDIFRANATDPDLGENGRVTYSLETDTNDFQINSNTGVLSVCNSLDRERQDLYELKIRATDNGAKLPDGISLHSEALVRVIIDDINDNPPKFGLSHYNVKVREDIPVGTVVAVLNAFDPDIGPEGEVNYFIEEDDSDGVFKIDKLSGTIRTTQPLDYESRQVHLLKIRASDLGSPSLSSKCDLTIHIADVNENMHAPMFPEPVVNGSVKENLSPGAYVMKIQAVDHDPPGDDSRIGYSIKGGDGVGLFSINDEGVIQTLATLDTETKSHYWLTVIAQDHGVVPLRSSVQVYIEVSNVNDNVPLSVEPVYYTSVPEDSGPGHPVLQVKATDQDQDPNQKLSYRIVGGNPEGYFSINKSTGLITTTSRRLDREHTDELILEVMISDDGDPPLSSTTRVVIAIEDNNDHAPEFEQQIYNIIVPTVPDSDSPMYQRNSTTSEVDLYDGAFESAHWRIFEQEELMDVPIVRVLAFDKDSGVNGKIEYSLKVGKKIKFTIDNTTGMIYASKDLEPSEYDLQVRATDGGMPPKSTTCRVVVQVIAIPSTSNNAPVIKPMTPVTVTESDTVGFLVALIQATDADNDTIWYDIVDGDPRNEFYIGRDNGNILLAHQLDWETQSEYTLNISATDGVHRTYSQLNISVININDHRPEFTQKYYKVEISENIPVGTEILKLEATDKDGNEKVMYSLHSAQCEHSLRIFRLDSLTGIITLQSPLDRETMSSHILTVMVRDSGTPAQRNYARVLIKVYDHNDHSPQFSEQLLEGKVYESAEIGSVVLRALAIDRDFGDNARITYSITSGNVGNVFTIDPQMGMIQVARELDLSSAKEYTLHIRATDHGNPPLASTVPAHIMVTMADNAKPKFINKDLSAEIYEDRPVGSFVTHVEARSTSSLLFEITDGNENNVFLISPSTGVIVTQKNLDYESRKVYNLTISATNMASMTAFSNIVIHVLDKNDNAPRFLNVFYEGSILENSPIGSLVLTNSSDPLVILAEDLDSEVNALLNYEIVESFPKKFFHIDSSTGAVRTLRVLDHETHEKFIFHVKLTDLGSPRLSAETLAKVQINIKDVNDCPPRFSQHMYNITLLLPTYKNVAVLQLNATDPDSPSTTTLRYDIIEGNKHEVFSINSENGVITVLDPEDMKPMHRLQVRLSDGKFSNIAKVNIKVEESEHSGLQFQQPFYTGSIVENSTKITTVCIVDVLGSTLNEHVQFKILNPTDMFEIGLTSGVIRTTGKRFDRELIDNYKLIVEARSELIEREKPRVAHVIVNVTIIDINDNCPMFVNLPYYAVVSVDDEKGSVITKVHAVDMDSGEFGEVRYELIKGNGELFKVCRKSGDIELKQSLEGHNREYELHIAAYDGGNQPCRTDVVVHVKVIDRSMPVFKKQFYSESIPENFELHSPLALSVEAESPLGRKLIYSIVKGNELEEFALDFNTAPESNNGPCVISVVDELDYEHQQHYELLIRATDSVSGVYAEVPVSVAVQDVNDCPPEFLQDSYNVSVSEAAPFGTAILRVDVRDNDTGINSKVTFSIQSTNTSSYFHIDPTDGTIYLKQSLDHEQSAIHHFVIVATDQGIPNLSSTAHVWVNVIDMNDNAPKFEQLTYSCSLSVHANRGQFVTVVQASDPDKVDQGRLRYSIVQGNELQTFSIQPDTGIISLMNLGNFGDQHTMSLNISVSDGVYTSFARLKVDLLPANLHSPVFTTVFTEATVYENKPPGQFVTTVKATDGDFGEFSQLTYSIHSELLNEKFSIDKDSGEITSKVSFDREKDKVFEIPIMATDFGGKSGFMAVRVKILDENDNAPQFLLKEYKASIHSNYTLGHIFLRIKATDLDLGESATIDYTIYEKTSSGENVLELFAINQTTGGIFLVKSAIPWESQVFQFFVRARDNGKPSLFSDVPVSVLIMSNTDQKPLFERKGDKFFLSENSSPGTIITKLKMATNMSVSFRILSDLDKNRPQFNIDDSGTLSLASPLDFEVKDSYIIGVLAETDSSPPLTSLAEVHLQVLDENDHSPIFETNPYIVTIAENVAEMTSLLKVTAHDKDQGNNGEVRYYFSPETEEAANVFTIDSYTGWITNLVKLDKETRPEYKFHITAMDNGNPRHITQTTVIIRLKDYNDQPTVFKNKNYEGAVNEDSLPGTVILQLETMDNDTDLTPNLTYYTIGGDQKAQFQISAGGEIYVSKPLDREEVSFYKLTVVVTDGVFTDMTDVKIDILDANDNPPYCLRHRYRQIISEGANPGTYILTILASDKDDSEHSKLKFILTGEGSEYFLLDKELGHLKINKPLDRELISKYSLVAIVQDRDNVNWECSSQIDIIISDLNDNAPLFSLPHYTVTLPENVEVGTLVTKVHATDVDIGINRKIKYAFIDSYNDHFKISSDSGIITLAKPLDREQKASYNLTLQALDQGTPQLSTITSLLVNVQDINDNPPEFASKYYFAIVPEIDSVGSEVVRVLATSKDTGINADITYTIVGGNEHKKFKIDQKTGVISISEMLDYERAKDYFLTIQATDGGDPPLSNRANVNITVTDSNDNAPVFTQVSYSARIKEDAQIGDRIIQVKAIDLDSGDNGRITYSIENGNRDDHFIINADTGYISVGAPLDRESISSYVLEVLAKDNGLPTLSRSVLVNVEISDVNDSPPLFSQHNYTTIVQEDKPLGYPILVFSVSDADAAPNGAPYTFDIRSGNEGGIFRLEQDGILRTATKFNHRVKDNYLLNIRVFDNGTRPLYSDTWVVVKVIEESQYPPILTPLEISINSYLDEYSGGIIGKVYATDQDKYDTLTYSLSPTVGIPYPISELFLIDRTDGTLKALPRLDVGEYRLNVSVTDGKYYSHTIVRVSVEIITDNMLENAVVVRFRNINPETFVLSHRKGFIRAIQKAMNCLPKDVVIISVQKAVNEYKRHKRELSVNGSATEIFETNGKIIDNKTINNYDDKTLVPRYSNLESLIQNLKNEIDISSESFVELSRIEKELNSPLDENLKRKADELENYLEQTVNDNKNSTFKSDEIRSRDKKELTITELQKEQLKNKILELESFLKTVKMEVAHRKVAPSYKFELQTIQNDFDDSSNLNFEKNDITNDNGNDKEIKNNLKRLKREVDNDIDVLFTVRKPIPGAFYSTDSIRKALNDNLDELMDSTKLVVVEIAQMKCTPTYCMSGVCQDRIILDTKEIQPISTDVTSFVSPNHKRKLECTCKEGYAGARCDKVVNNCAHEPCPSFKICIPDASLQGYTCQCPDGFTGSLCDIDISKCHDDSCYSPRNPVSFSGKSYAQYRIINKKAIEDQQILSLRIRTMYPTGNLMFAKGRIDYNVLEVANGAVQYRFDLGTGEGLVRVSSVYVSDGRWHEIKLERDRNSARLTVDGKHIATGSAPGVSDILNLQDEYMYFGAEVHQHPSILGFEDIQNGYYGCMDDVRISRMSVPLHLSASESNVAVLMRFTNVEFSCPNNSAIMVSPGPCGSQPCQNGGTCKEIQGNLGYECHCHSRFVGPLCEIDMDPCASQPCLFGGKCKNNGGTFTCECVPRLTGSRCEYGRYCSPNPCKHGGACEEGDEAPLCKCRSFTGDLCDYDIDECKSQPCLNGGTCINEIGSYRCLCPQNMTGLHCNIPNYPVAFMFMNLPLETWILAGVCAIFFVILIITLYCCIKKCCAKRRRNRARINNQTGKEPPSIYLNSTRSHEMTDFKRGSKMSNLEVNRRDATMCPARPVSYTPSTNEQPYINSHVLNNLDTLRSYGSAGDELENVPPDYLRNLNRTSGPVPNHNSDTDSLHKPTWAEQMQMANMGDTNKIKNDLKLASPVLREQVPKLIANSTRNYSHPNEMENPGMVGGYHWDCSDWVRRSQNPLPNITEVPGSEVPDSSSFHSNESNESRHHLMNGMGPIDPTRDIDTLNEDESEYVADSECEPCPVSPGLNALNDCGESFRFNTADSYLRHPNSYLPSHAYNIPSEAEHDGPRLRKNYNSADSENDVESYGFPSKRNRRKDINDEDLGSIMLDERHSLLGLNTSNSDLSTNVCELEDSDNETEHKPLNCGIQQTSV